MFKSISYQVSGIKQFRRKINFGFTLPELLIVMTILAGLAAVMMVSYPATQKRARDTKRVSDIKQYQTAIELYANKNGSYQGLTGTNPAGMCNALGLTSCPSDPKGAPFGYNIRVNATTYSLWSQLEVRTNSSTPKYFVLCSDGRAGYCSTPPTSTICGACP